MAAVGVGTVVERLRYGVVCRPSGSMISVSTRSIAGYTDWSSPIRK